MSEELVCVGQFNTPELAHVARFELESEGIQSFLDNEWVASMDWSLTNAVGGVKLLVSSLDAKNASEILNSRSRFQWEERESDIDCDESEGNETRSIDTNDREENALRAFRGAILGLLFLPVQFYICYLLLFKVLGSDLPLSAKRKQQVIIAAIINIPSMLILLLFLRSLVSLFNVQ